MSWQGVITNAGAALLSECLQGGSGVIFDKVYTGTGTYATTTAMKEATALASSVKDTGASVASINRDGSNVSFRLRVSPASATIGSYDMKQVGLYGHKQSTSTNTLVAIFQSDSAITIPLVSSFPDFAYTLAATLSIENDDLSITINANAVATLGDLDIMMGAESGEPVPTFEEKLTAVFPDYLSASLGGTSPLFVQKVYTAQNNQTILANESYTFLSSAMSPSYFPSGYKPIGILAINCGAASVAFNYVQAVSFSGSGIVLRIKNITNQTFSPGDLRIYITIMFAKTAYIKNLDA